jgi:formamidopyrimidine-DNA glycosylase
LTVRRRRRGAHRGGPPTCWSFAIDNGGTTLRDFVGADGVPGDNGEYLLVYGRAGEPCPRCGTAIKKAMQAGRATYWCPTCQAR